VSDLSGDRTGLDELIGRYLSPAIPVHRDLDLALGAFRPEWRRPGMPAGFAPQESVLTLVGPP
jgi:hypothetical protein